MARLQKIGVDYFPHYIGSRDGKTLYILKSKFGNDGYAFWYQLLEVLGGQKELCYACDKKSNWLYLTATTGVTEDRATEILDMLAELEEIDAELWRTDKMIWCQDFVDQLDPIYRKRRIETPKRPLLQSELIALREREKEEKEKQDKVVKVEEVESEPSSKKTNKNSEERDLKESKTEVYGVEVEKTLREPFMRWLAHKKGKGKEYKTELSVRTCYEQLLNYSKGKPDVANDIINKSIAMNYDGFFEPDAIKGKPRDCVPEYLTNVPETYAGAQTSTI